MTLARGSPEFAEALGQAIVELSYCFCGVERDKRPVPGQVVAGLNKLAPVYVAATERRDGPGAAQRKRYSSCGDQLHAILERVGVREPWVNRASLGQYRATKNIQELEPYDARNNPIGSTAAVYAPKDPAYRPPPGSLCLIWTTGYDAHALVALGPGSDAGHVLTGNYGAGGMSESITPGANVADSPCSWDPAREALTIGGSHRVLHCVITPAALAAHITAQIDLTGCQVTGELLDALGAKYGPE